MPEPAATLLPRPSPIRDAGTDVRPGWVAGLVAAGWAAGIGLVLLGVVALVVWADDGATAAVAPTLGSAVDVWLVAQGSGVRVGSAAIGLVPWGLAVLPLALLHRGGRWAAVAADVRSLREAGRVLAVGAGGYAGLAGVLALLAARDGLAVPAPRALLATASVAAVGLGSGLAREAGLWPALGQRVPRRVREALLGGVVAAAAVLAGGALLVLAAVAASAARIAGLVGDLGVGPVGGGLLTLLGAALLPNAAVWAAAVCLGPGFAVGTGTSFGTGSVRLGAVPALPVLGALPETMPRAVGVAALLVPAVAGGLAAWVLSRRRAAAGRTGLLSALLDALAAAAGAGLLLGLATALTRGAAGDGRLRDIGAVPWQVAAAGAVEVALVALLATAVLLWRDRNRSGDAAVAADAVDAVDRPDQFSAAGEPVLGLADTEPGDPTD